MPIDVASYLKFTPTDNTGSFAADAEGHVYYDDSQAQLKHYNGDDWINVNTNVNVDRPGDGQYTVDSYTKLLIHSDTSNNSTTFDDSSSSSHTITERDANHSTAQAKIGATSMHFDGTGDYLTIPDNADFDFGTGAFTLDMWIMTNSAVSSERFISGGTESNGASQQWFFGRFGSQSKLNFGIQHGSGYTENGSNTITWNTGTWYHAALVRPESSDTVYYYWNGVGVGSLDIGTTSTAVNTGAYGIVIGARYYNQNIIEQFNGYMDEIRVSKGIARWTSDFTVY